MSEDFVFSLNKNPAPAQGFVILCDFSIENMVESSQVSEIPVDDSSIENLENVLECVIHTDDCSSFV